MHVQENLQLGRRNRYWPNDVNMCHGSKCMKEPMKYRPYVAASEMTMFRNVALVSTRLRRKVRKEHRTSDQWINSLWEIFPSCNCMRNSAVNRVSGTPQCDHVAQAEQEDSDHVSPFRTLSPPLAISNRVMNSYSSQDPLADDFQENRPLPRREERCKAKLIPKRSVTLTDKILMEAYRPSRRLRTQSDRLRYWGNWMHRHLPRLMLRKKPTIHVKNKYNSPL